MRRRVLCVCLLLCMSIVSVAVAASSYLTTSEFIEVLQPYTGCSTLDELWMSCYINQYEYSTMKSAAPTGYMIQSILLPIFEHYPYPCSEYPSRLPYKKYDEASAYLSSFGWKVHNSDYTKSEVLKLIQFIQNLPKQNRDCTRLNYTATNALDTALKTLPSKYLDWMQLNGWEFVTGDPLLQERYNYTNCIGSTSYAEKKIYLFDCDSSTVFHELGHAVTHYACGAALWQSLYELESSGMRGYYASANWSEFAACAFEYMYIKPEKLLDRAPVTYMVMLRGFYMPESTYDTTWLRFMQNNTFLLQTLTLILQRG